MLAPPFAAPLATATAHIRHRRYAPKPHHFESTLTYLWFDPDQAKTFCQQSPVWTTQGWNIIALRDEDFLPRFTGTIRHKVQQQLLELAIQGSINLTAAQSQHLISKDCDWQIRVLALPRCWGKRFNSVVFYFILDPSFKPLFILTEITNTPWDERVVYGHDCQQQAQAHTNKGDTATDSDTVTQTATSFQNYSNPIEYEGYQFDFEKAFHVSPFMPMELHYRWRFSFSAQRTVILMQLFEQQQLIFDASMQFSLQPITFPSQLNRYAMRYSLEPLKMLGAIYYQALRLWLKKIPFHPHPNKRQDG